MKKNAISSNLTQPEKQRNINSLDVSFKVVICLNAAEILTMDPNSTHLESFEGPRAFENRG